MIGLDMMCIYLETQPLLGTPGMMTWDIEVGLYIYYSDETMEHGRRYRNSSLQMGRMMIGFGIVCQYPETILPLGTFETMRGSVIADMVTFTPILAGSVLRMTR